ncbi:MAG: hypothetical protein IT373_09410 [Polyangiaceae bacterium]|nr:hypothetical protein [Polyangiaceae bacterium]
MTARRSATWPWALGATLALGVAGAWASGCSTPSSELDGGDLRGVFDRTTSTGAGAPSGSSRDGGAPRPKTRPSASASASAEPEPTVVPLRRPPVPGPCIDPHGEPAGKPDHFVGRPACRGARILEWKDPDGAPRYACVYAADDAANRAPLPAVLFFHAEWDKPSAVGDRTKLRRRLGSFALSDDPRHAGFVVVAVQARRAEGWDVGYTARDNPDAVAADHFLGLLEAEGLVDVRRVYALGDARGGVMAALYAALRPDRIAAFAAFGADATRIGWTCAAPEPPAMALYRACDSVVACDAVESWVDLRRRRGALTRALRLGPSKSEEPYCVPRAQCGENQGKANHARWPDLREEDVLEFFARYSLESRAP